MSNDLVERVSCAVPSDWSSDFSQCLYDWQGLEAGALAIVAAIIGYRAIRAQSKQTKIIEARKAKRRYESRRATLPLVLSSASSYGEEVIRELARARNLLASHTASQLAGNWTPPDFPENLVSDFQDFIESSDNNSANELIFELLRQLQTLRSRLISLIANDGSTRVAVRFNIAEYQLQAGKVIQICEALFPFSRGEDGSLPSELARPDAISKVTITDHNAEDDQQFSKRAEIFLKVERPWWTIDDRP